MSMIACDSCGLLIDTDDDPDCFLENLAGTIVPVCMACRHAEDEVAEEEDESDV